MDTPRTDLIIQYALAVAGEADDFRERELGPIHLIKFVYLADLAHAERGDGGTFTGAAWHFHNFGPWSLEVFNRIAPAAKAIGGTERRFSSRHKEDAVRWRAQDSGLAERIERKLPLEVARAVKHAVREYGTDTKSLLHDVYRTRPMLTAAPGELLNFKPSAPERTSGSGDGHEEATRPLPQLSKTKVKNLKALVQRRLEEKRQLKRLVPPQPAPRYDEVFEQGQEWLDALAGEPINPERGRLRFANSLWKSAARRDPEIP